MGWGGHYFFNLSNRKESSLRSLCKGKTRAALEASGAIHRIFTRFVPKGSECAKKIAAHIWQEAPGGGGDGPQGNPVHCPTVMDFEPMLKAFLEECRLPLRNIFSDKFVIVFEGEAYPFKVLETERRKKEAGAQDV